jgi:hypothetical protein
MADDFSFDTVHTENMGYCPNETTVSGVKADAYYCPMAQLATITKPTITPTSAYADRVTLAALVPVVGKGFKKMTLLIDENELKNGLVGVKGNMKAQAMLDGMLIDFTKRNLGFIATHLNTPMCWVVVDSEGQKWVLLDGYLTKADSTTAKKFGDNSGTPFNITAHSQLYAFDGDITVTADTP